MKRAARGLKKRAVRMRGSRRKASTTSNIRKVEARSKKKLVKLPKEKVVTPKKRGRPPKEKVVTAKEKAVAPKKKVVTPKKPSKPTK